eukprot:CAMPEP_0179339150 /NCGR_PEP_ID=MMETSP0797-20121207/68557_1 /TAXON_ID=47934 /ORGANISM="Dinophysis acuminata, Strain DAEP01" /LENGTH=62 /DNA_ID=CAMNT_0021052953 /DNA_START=61 /DNA_END=246 /DNA_ORIENTATION=+
MQSVPGAPVELPMAAGRTPGNEFGQLHLQRSRARGDRLKATPHADIHPGAAPLLFLRAGVDS